MKRLGLLFLWLSVYSQNPLGYEWLSENQTYWKLLVAQEGIYRVYAQDLPIPSNVHPDYIHIYYRGQEIPIYIYNQGDLNRLDAGDYIEFYAKPNDGLLEAQMYRNPITGLGDPSQQPDSLFSLFSDTAAYFLTWNNTPGLRYAAFSDYNNNYPVINHVRYMSRVAYHIYWPGSGSLQNGLHFIKNPLYITGEGYSGNYISTPVEVDVPTPYPASNPLQPPVVHVRVIGTDLSKPHKIHFQCGSSALTYQQPFSSEGIYPFVKTFVLTPQQSEILHPSTKVTISPLEGVFRICWVHIFYDRLPNLGGEAQLGFEIVNPYTQRAVITFSNIGFSGTNDELLIYDLSGRYRITGIRNGNDYQAVLPGYTGSHRFFVCAASNVKQPIIVPASLRFLNKPNNGAEFVIITHRDFSASAQAYKIYRDTNSLYPLKSIVVYVDEIYDEFGYGTPSPLAIRNFVQTALQNWNPKPRYLLLWGKGGFLLREYGHIFKVPTWGQPASDLLFACGFDPNDVSFLPQLHVGRVNIMSDQEGFDYLEKIKRYEHTPFQPWMKNAIHLGGGANAYEQNRIYNYIKNVWGAIFEGIPYIGNVHYVQKTTTSTVGNSLVDTIKHIVDSGCVIINFFGHSSTNIYDVNIGEPYEYDNEGRYPLIIANGCYAGNFAITSKSFAEKWVNGAGSKGAIGYVSASGPGFLYWLGEYTKVFYEIAFRDSIGVPVGHILTETIRRYWTEIADSTTFYRDIQWFNHALMTNLQGDPALRLYSATKPDLAIYENEVQFLPEELNAQLDSITIQLIVHNHGLALQNDDSFYVRIRQQPLNQGIIKDYGEFLFPPFKTNVDTLRIRIPSLGESAAGINRFEIYVDSRDSIAEMTELNNQISIEIYIPSNIPAIIYPWRYAVVNKPQIALMAGTYNMQNTQPVRYIFEIDTVYTFNSPFKRSSGVIQGTATLAKWDLPFTLQDSMVYYWRVRLADESKIRWATASFRYIAGPSEGFAQAKPPQFLENTNDGVQFQPPSFVWDFTPTTAVLRVDYELGRPYVLYNAVALTNPVTSSYPKGLYIIHIDGRTLELKSNTTYIPTPDGIPQLIALIQQMNEGDYLLILGRYGADAPSYPQELWDAFASLGISLQLKQRATTVNHFSILGRKGAAVGTAIEVLDPPYTFTTLLYSKRKEAYSESPVLGPAKEWKQLLWNWFTIDNTLNSDQAYIELYGVKKDGTKILLRNGLTKGTYDLSTIDAQQYPFLQIRCYMKDSIYRSAPQIDHWHLLYAPVPEASVMPQYRFAFYKDTLDEGEETWVILAAQNISDLPMDSLLVRFELLLQNDERILLGEKRFKPLNPWDTLHIFYRFSTAGYPGRNLLIITINPDFDQPERSLHNNQYVHAFFVRRDVINPILDVTFDGKHIIDGDIVSPTPEILIEVNDENPYFLIQDTSQIVVAMKPADRFGPPDRIFYASGLLEFIPADDPKENKARVYFRPGPLEDGEYLLEVQAYDARRNPAGKTSYRIRFRVINESTITHVFNYPNPFSTSTRFVYTLTGSVLPEVFQIHIYTITGRLVKVIDLVELGEVSIGRHITNYAWDGTDENGDPLANGVYLYRVVIKMPEGKTLRINDPAENQRYFKGGWGKMYLMR